MMASKGLGVSEDGDCGDAFVRSAVEEDSKSVALMPCAEAEPLEASIWEAAYNLTAYKSQHQSPKSPMKCPRRKRHDDNMLTSARRRATHNCLEQCGWLCYSQKLQLQGGSA